jgi:tripartite-type tricarboxylate transporter receptor subunit TctC
MRNGLTRRVTGLIGGALLAGLVAGPALAQGYPAKPLKMIVGFAAGGPTDVGARVLAEAMSADLGQPIVVENRGGAGGQLGYEALKASPADGYTISLLMTPVVVASMVAGKTVSPSDVTPVAFLYDSTFIMLVNPAAPHMADVKTMKDLVAAVKANPGKVNYTSAGTGSTGHLFGARIGKALDLDWEHIGYPGIGPASTDLMAGRIAVAMGNFPNDVQFIKEGKLRAITTSGETRMERYPDAPSLKESGFAELSLGTWAGVVGPAGMPKEATERLDRAVQAFFARPDMVAKMALHLPEPKYGSGAALDARLKGDIAAIDRVIKEAGIKAN